MQHALLQRHCLCRNSYVAVNEIHGTTCTQIVQLAGTLNVNRITPLLKGSSPLGTAFAPIQRKEVCMHVSADSTSLA